MLLFHHGQVAEMRCLRQFCQWKHDVRGCGWVFNVALSSQVMGWWRLVEGPSSAACAPCSPPASWLALLVSSCSWAACTSAQSPASPQRTAAWRGSCQQHRGGSGECCSCQLQQTLVLHLPDRVNCPHGVTEMLEFTSWFFWTLVCCIWTETEGCCWTRHIHWSAVPRKLCPLLVPLPAL